MLSSFHDGGPGFVQNAAPYLFFDSACAVLIASIFMALLYGIGLIVQRLLRRRGVKSLTIAAVLGWAALAGIFFCVVPTFVQIFSSFGAELPFPTALIVAHPRSVCGPLCLGMIIFSAGKDLYIQRRWLDWGLLVSCSVAVGLTIISLFTPMFGLGSFAGVPG